MNQKKVSVIIPSYNRFKFLLHAIKSVKEQTHKNVQIIVINDASTEKEYKEFNFEELGVYIIHLEENSYKKFGYSNLGYVRNQGIQKATGDYVAFLDDDDYWLPTKLEEQFIAMDTYDCKMSSTNACWDVINGIGGLYDPKRRTYYTNVYNYNSTYKMFYDLENKFNQNECSKIPGFLVQGFDKSNPKFGWNPFISASVIVDRKLLAQVGNYSEEPPPGEDQETWLKILKYTDSILVNKELIYYDIGHGNGQQWKISDDSKWKPPSS